MLGLRCLQARKRISILLLVAMQSGVSALGYSDWRGFQVHGFADQRAGIRLQQDPSQQQTSLAESRLQLDFLRYGRSLTTHIRADLLYDAVAQEIDDIHLETGRGFLDLREAHISATPTRWMDLKLGRQIMTWGTGDLVFINDLFPKDWQAFFTGREVSYLKAPSDALFTSFFPNFANIDVVYTPRFDADRFIRGERLSYWNPATQQLAGRNAIVRPVVPKRWLDDDEWALRISRNLGGTEWAAYFYDGFWKSPSGFDAATGQARFPALQVIGASMRRTLAGGIFSLEVGHYDSREDHTGGDPLTPNSEWRFLVAYEKEIFRQTTLGLQYYREHLRNYANLIANLPQAQPQPDRNRHVLTVRLTRTAWSQNLTLSIFGYAVSNDQDAYLRPFANYKVTDHWTVSTGANLWWGDAEHTFFAQFQDNSNLYAAVRYSF